MSNSTYILKKFIELLITLFMLSIVVFVMSRMAPGDPHRAYFGEAVERMTPEQLEIARKSLGLEASMVVQYKEWLINALQGNFGVSYKYRQDAFSVIQNVFLNTFFLIGFSFGLILIFSCLLALFCVRNEGTRIERVINKIGIATGSIPVFFVALVLILVFSVELQLLPSSGAYTYSSKGAFYERIPYLILPVMSIVLTHLWYCTHMIKSKLSDEVRKEYVLLCKAKGLSEMHILVFHCMKNIMPAIVSIMAIFLPHLIGSTYIVEMVFSYPGLGRLGFESALYHDYNMLMLVSLLTGFIVIICSMLAQVIHEKLDPRMGDEELRGGTWFE